MNARRENIANLIGAGIALVLILSSAYLLRGVLHAPPPQPPPSLDRQFHFESVSVPIAELPWTRDSAKPAPILLPIAVSPFISRPIGTPVRVAIASVPHLPIRRDPHNPTPTVVRGAEVPWKRSAKQIQPVAVEQARLPRIPPHRDVDKPAAIQVPTAQVPQLPTTRPAPK